MKKITIAGAIAVALISLSAMADDYPYHPASIDSLTSQQAKTLQELPLAFAETLCSPRFAKAYIWRQVSQEQYEGMMSSLGQNNGYGQDDSTSDGYGDFQKHIQIGLVAADTAAVGMYCVKTRAAGAASNIRTMDSPTEAWVNEDDPEHVVVRDLNGVQIKGWDEIQSYVESAKQKASRDNF